MTANSDVQRLFNSLRNYLPGAVDAAIQQEFFTIMDEFFTRTNIWQEDITFTSIVGTTSYAITPSGISQINRLLSLTDPDDNPVDAMLYPDPTTLLLRLTPSTAQVLTARVALTVTDPVDRDGNVVFPQWIIGKYNDTIQSGIMSRMYLQPAKPWSNLQLAKVHAGNYADGVNLARSEAKKGHTYATQAWRFPQSFSTRRRGF